MSVLSYEDDTSPIGATERAYAAGCTCIYCQQRRAKERAAAVKAPYHARTNPDGSVTKSNVPLRLVGWTLHLSSGDTITTADERRLFEWRRCIDLGYAHWSKCYITSDYEGVVPQQKPEQPKPVVSEGLRIIRKFYGINPGKAALEIAEEIDFVISRIKSVSAAANPADDKVNR